MSTVESIRHLIMECPSTNNIRIAMYAEIKRIDPYYDERCALYPGDPVYWLLGKYIDNVDAEVMLDIWKISWECIKRMYLQTVGKRESNN